MSTTIFLYGTLRHVPLLEAVLGRAVDGLELAMARLDDHRPHHVRGRPFPVLTAAPGQGAEGLLVRGLDAGDVARLRFYEGEEDYELREVAVRDGGGRQHRAEAFFARAGRWQAGGPWSLEDWLRDWAEVSVMVAEEAMAHFGRLASAEVALLAPAMERRAAAVLAARARTSTAPARDVEMLARRRPYSRFFALDETDLRFRRFDGAMSPVQTRAALIAGEAAAVLPYDPRQDRVLLVQQFRAPLFMAGDPDPWLWEPVAGYVDAGESPDATARREAEEEAGLTLDVLDPAGGAYSSAGNSTEFVHLFIGIADFTTRAGGGGLDTEGEDIRSRSLPAAELFEALDRGRLRDMPLVALALWLGRHHERLRAAGSATG
ncbi:NUDIX domain-containing protein [Pontibaca methylaminivorans]|uniref:ADP-ribose pyrophosphatase n=1 Tax=Pontibaca methylaminivorans TaxID=515897 RepID=A0A1R3WB31_9RHOB|nr:NUDIX domain-containing protein [Pontibaca methylaminivorans]SIT75062.1 nudix-type nucleoside diphosphatase, YffH/AdpP family [Pontibaca methylaminivorans]